jgi:3-phosphoshikimate 1-carboxyvinyltransferase
LIIAALAKGKCTLRGALWADDTQVMVDSLQKLGFKVEVQLDPAEESNRTIIVEGRGGEIPAKKAELYVGNAGTAARFLTALVCLGHGEYRITGDPRMHERPMGELFRSLGIPGEHLPVTVHAAGMKPSRLRVSGEESSQFASALMLTGHTVETAPHAYVELTRQVMESFQSDYAVEPDLSGASYFVASEWITGGRVTVAGWPNRSLQIDGQFPRFLPPPARLSRQTDLGDSVMTLAICALFGKQPMTLTDASRMREQECDRIAALVTELKRVGAKVEEHRDGLTVWPGEKLHGADIETYNDHRMAMCFAVLGLKVPGIRIKNPACVSKTFPNFFEKLEQLRQ